jgi:hypothetical protein
MLMNTPRALALGLCAATALAAPTAASATGRAPVHHPWSWHRPAHTGVLAGGPGATASDTPGVLAGIAYDTLGAHGTTDATGTFKDPFHAPVVFSIGHVTLGTNLDDDVVTPFALAADAGCTTTATVARELQFLEALDADKDPNNGIAIDKATRARAARHDVVPRPIRIGDLSDTELQRLVTEITGTATLPDRTAALNRFADQMDAETWQEQGLTTYRSNLAELVQIITDYSKGIISPPALLERQQGLIRSQGLTSDGSSLIFSWQFGLMRTTTDSAETVLARNTLAIPAAIAAVGGNHIGDVDVAGGKLYAPIEDGPKYQHPFIAVFDAQTLQFTGEDHELPQALHTEGVPWVAVDQRRGVFYTAEWNNTNVINVFDLKTFTLVKTITLDQTLGRIQGAKLHDGMLYAFADLKNVDRPVYKINPDTGHVLTVDHIALPAGAESEGLAFFAQPDGTLMHTLDVTPDQTATNLRDHLLTQPSLRSRVCGDTPLWHTDED